MAQDIVFYSQTLSFLLLSGQRLLILTLYPLHPFFLPVTEDPSFSENMATLIKRRTGLWNLIFFPLLHPSATM